MKLFKKKQVSLSVFKMEQPNAYLIAIASNEIKESIFQSLW